MGWEGRYCSHMMLLSDNSGQTWHALLLQDCVSIFLGSFAWAIACRMVGLEGVTHRLYWLKAIGLC